MGVRAVRITVLKSAGGLTRDECHDLNAEKIWPVKCFVFTRCGICSCQQFSKAGVAGWVQKFQPMANWRGGGLLPPSRYITLREWMLSLSASIAR